LRVKDPGIRGSGSRIKGLRFRVKHSGFRVSGLGVGFQDIVLRV
jgi:hypothetical protein